jgi:hydroxyethylthiazole kinase-like uncharacterized protein yjeF
MHPLYTVAQIRLAETTASLEPATDTLMQRAGKTAANFAFTLIDPEAPKSSILILAGPGNNGGDAIETATQLTAISRTIRVVVWFLGNIEQLPPDAAAAAERAQRAGIAIQPMADANAIDQEPWTLIIDGLFGIGVQRPFQAPLAALIQAVNRCHCPILSLDVPSGIDSDTGALTSANGVAVRATHTLTFLGDKPGLHTGTGIDHAGRVKVDMLGVASALMPNTSLHLNDIDVFRAYLRPRSLNTHKGSFGTVIVAGGASGMTGATVLSARCALHTGAGKVFAAFLDHPPSVDWQHPELMLRHAADIDFSGAALAVGSGMGESEAALLLLTRALSHDGPLTLDADALNLLAQHPALQHRLVQRPRPAILTPHPLEAARLLQCDVASIQSDRIVAAVQLAQRLNAIVVLKGAGTVIASPYDHGRVLINPTGGPALATAGTGDVLAGVCVSLQAQGWGDEEAAAAAVWMHGAAADTLVLRDHEPIGPIGMTASELIPAIRCQHNRLVTLAQSLKK